MYVNLGSNEVTSKMVDSVGAPDSTQPCHVFQRTERSITTPHASDHSHLSQESVVSPSYEVEEGQ